MIVVISLPMLSWWLIELVDCELVKYKYTRTRLDRFDVVYVYVPIENISLRTIRS